MHLLQKERFKKHTAKRFKDSMMKLNLCNHSDAYILVSGTITITGEEDNDADKKGR